MFSVLIAIVFTLAIFMSIIEVTNLSFVISGKATRTP